MISIYVCVLLSSYWLSFATTNGAQQKISHNSVLNCYVENTTGSSYDAREEESRVETAVCDFPTTTYRNSITYNYTLPLTVNNISQRVPLTIEFNETTTRNDTTFPLNYVMEGDGIVTSNAFIGYHARELAITAVINPYKCDTTGVFTQSIYVLTYLAVFPASLSGQPLNDIRSMLTHTNQSISYNSLIIYNLNNWFTGINSTGLVCFGSNLITYSANN